MDLWPYVQFAIDVITNLVFKVFSRTSHGGGQKYIEIGWIHHKSIVNKCNPCLILHILKKTKVVNVENVWCTYTIIFKIYYMFEMILIVLK
jgi:hypothetical protein